MKRLFVLLATVVSLCWSLSAQATIVSDNFNRVDSGTLGANWSPSFGQGLPMSIQSNMAGTPNGNFCAEVWTADSFSSDQFSKVKFVLVSTGNDSEVTVRTQPGTNSGYLAGVRLAIDTTHYSIWKAVAGVATTLQTTSTVAVNNDVVELDAIGTTLTLIVNNVTIATLTDTSLSGGAPGLRVNNGGIIQAPFDDWSGGDTRVFLPHTGGQLISAPLFPQATPSATYPPDTGYTLTAVASGANLQTAINAVACGTKLNLAHGGTFTTATPWTLPANACACHTDPTKWQIIQGDQFGANYVAGVRVDPSVQYAQFPHLSSSDGNYAFQVTANGVNCWGFAGLDVTETTDGANAVFNWGDASFTQANFPKDVAWWANYIHGQPTKGLTRCILYNGTGAAVVDNYISDCHKVGQDSQCFVEFDGFGVVLFQNNFCEGATENFLVGGSDPFTPGTIVADFTYQKNHNFKPLSWRVADPSYAGIHWSIKNIWELKGAQRLNVNSNVFENSWGDGQVGNLITINSDNQNGTNFYGVNQDINFFYNIIKHGTQAYQLGNNVLSVYQSNNRFSFHDNLAFDINDSKWSNVFQGGIASIGLSGKQTGSIFGPHDIWINHDTIETSGGGAYTFLLSGNYPGPDAAYGVTLTNSVLGGPTMAFMGCNGQGGGDLLLTVPCSPNANYTYDCMYGRPGGDGNTYANAAFAHRQTPNTAALVFVNPGVDFHVAASSVCHAAASDGLDIGANIDAVNAATAGVVQTLGNLHTVTNVSPSTFTNAGGTTITITGTNFINESAFGVIIGGAGPVAAVSTDICAVNTCTVVTSAPITLAVNDTVNMVGMLNGSGNAFSDQRQFIVASVTNTTHFTYTDNGVGTQSWTGGTANRITPGNACTSVVVVNSTTITCTTPAATGTVTNGPVSVFVSQFGIPVQSTVFGNYN